MSRASGIETEEKVHDVTSQVQARATTQSQLIPHPPPPSVPLLLWKMVTHEAIEKRMQ